MESELETMQAESVKLIDELEAQKRICSGSEQQRETLLTEVTTISMVIV